MVQTATSFDLALVGGGVAGGALGGALAALEADARILLVEQIRASGAINRGDLLWPPHLEMLDRWNVLAEIRRRGAVPMRYNELYDNAGRLLLRSDRRAFRSRFESALALEHPQIEEALLPWPPGIQPDDLAPRPVRGD